MVLPRHVNPEEHTDIIVNPNKDHSLKYCARCDKEIPITEFYKNAVKADGLSTYCKEHAKAATAKTRANQKKAGRKRA